MHSRSSVLFTSMNDSIVRGNFMLFEVLLRTMSLFYSWFWWEEVEVAIPQSLPPSHFMWVPLYVTCFLFYPVSKEWYFVFLNFHLSLASQFILGLLHYSFKMKVHLKPTPPQHHSFKKIILILIYIWLFSLVLKFCTQSNIVA